VSAPRTVSERIRAAVASLGSASLDQVRQLVPEATGSWMHSLAQAGHLVREGRPRAFTYTIGRTPNPYGGAPEDLAARADQRRLRANAAARAKYAAARGGKVKPRAPAVGSAALAPRSRPKPTARQQVVIAPATSDTAPPRARSAPRMTSKEWEASGGQVQRLPPGAVSKSELRFHPPPGIDRASTSD